MGDEVITTSHSWISTSETITQAGGKVVFCDTEEDGFNIDADLIEEKITSKTVGLIPVHLFGHPAEMNKIRNKGKRTRNLSNCFSGGSPWKVSYEFATKYTAAIGRSPLRKMPK